MTRYRMADQIPAEVTAELGAFDELTQRLLYRRGIGSADAAYTFLNPSYDTDRHDPFLLHDMEKAVARVLRAIENKEKIAIYADYDCDGIPGAVILNDFLTAVGHENFMVYIPHRHYEGFGFSTEAVHKLHVDSVDLIITIDCGVSDHEAVAAATLHEIDVIVTDHHEPKATLPEALAVVNPKIGDTYPFPDLCGAAVIFKLVEALIARGEFSLVPGYEKWWLDMVGVATIADMVPLVGENRVFARYGLDVLRKSRRPGLQQLLKKAQASQRHLTEDDIGFTIGPRINAASRMDTPEDAFFMLSKQDVGEASVHLDHLEKLNTERRSLVAQMTKEVNKRLKELPELPGVIVLGNPAWRPALVGLAANKLAETYNRPAFLWGRDGNGVIKGSCRSDGEVSVVALMDTIADMLIEHGGHHMSGGFAVTDESIFSLPTRLEEAMRSLGTAAVAPQEVIDAELSLADINSGLKRALASLAPFGTSNPKPLFQFSNITPEHVEVFGKAKDHTKLVFKTPTDRIEAIAFFHTPESFRVVPKVGEELTLLAHLEESFFMGRLQTRLRIVDIL